MTTAVDPFRSFSAELQVIRRLNSSLYGAGGREGRAGHANSLFSSFHPPAIKHGTLAPLRVDVPLLDPCCGQLSAGAEVDLGLKGRQKFIDFHHVASALWVPLAFRERPKTASSSSGICKDLSEAKAWNSRRISDAVSRSRLKGSSKPVEFQTNSLKTSTEATSHSSLPQKQAGPQDDFSDLKVSMDKSVAVQRYRYTSATERSYEEVGGNTRLPRCLKAPETTLEKMADTVSEHPSSRRYASQPQLWQSVGDEWNKKQLRSRNDAKKPISFCSRCPRSGQIPLYTGTIGSENMDNIDDIDEDFKPLTLKRSVVPPYTPTSHRATIPGYTGKAMYANSATDAAASSVPAVCSPAHSPGTIKESGSPFFGHVAPLSRTVTTVTPCNPFMRPTLPASHTSTQGKF